MMHIDIRGVRALLRDERGLFWQLLSSMTDMTELPRTDGRPAGVYVHLTRWDAEPAVAIRYEYPSGTGQGGIGRVFQQPVDLLRTGADGNVRVRCETASNPVPPESSNGTA